MYGPSGSEMMTLFVLALMGLTLGVWKLIELVWWIASHIQWV